MVDDSTKSASIAFRLSHFNLTLVKFQDTRLQILGPRLNDLSDLHCVYIRNSKV